MIDFKCIKSYGLSIGLGVLLVLPTLAQDTEDAFEKFSRKQDSLFNNFDQDMDDKYNAFVARQDSLYSAFVERVDRLWNDKVYPSQKDYVEYKNNYQDRVHIDFEVGKVEAAVLVNENQPAAIEQATAKLKQILKESISNPGRLEPYEAADNVPEAVGQSLLEGQIVDPNSGAVGGANADTFIENVVSEAGIKVDTIESKDGKRRIKLAAGYELVPDHLRKRAEQYLEMVRNYSSIYELDLRLVMAIIHTESYFNPRATSRIPAFGLMQIVPTSAGRDAYKHVYKEDRLLEANYLYDPQKNIELGCAYFYIVRNHYLKKIKSDQLAYPCAIASYNGGIGTLCKALTGSKKLKLVGETVNNMSYSELIKRLNQNLPYQETRDYVNRVLERMAFYDEWAD